MLALNMCFMFFLFLQHTSLFSHIQVTRSARKQRRGLRNTLDSSTTSSHNRRTTARSCVSTQTPNSSRDAVRQGRGLQGQGYIQKLTSDSVSSHKTYPKKLGHLCKKSEDKSQILLLWLKFLYFCGQSSQKGVLGNKNWMSTYCICL